MYILNAKFEWDLVKAELNQHKHGISFEEALKAFDDPWALIAPDLQHSESESRFWLIGEGNSGTLMVVVFTRRGDATRLISARRANRRERRLYEASKGIPV